MFKHSVFTVLLPLTLGLIIYCSLPFETLASEPNNTPTPNQDRLAEPTLPASASQADLGAQVYWLNCLPCHGDKGQGLTSEFRLLYPEEDRNCWNAGCHGERPYENGWTLPASVPEIIGEGALNNFKTADQLSSFIQYAMPFQAPGSLDDESYAQVTSFLLRENHLEERKVELSADGISQIRFKSLSNAALIILAVLLIMGSVSWLFLRSRQGSRDSQDL